MDTDFDAVVKRYMEFNHTLSDEGVEGLRDLASTEVRWKPGRSCRNCFTLSDFG